MYLFATCKFWLRADWHPMAIYIHSFIIARGHVIHIILFLVSRGARISSWEGKDDNSKKKMTELDRTILAYVQIIASSCCSLVYISEITLDIKILKEIKNQYILTNQYQVNSSSKVEFSHKKALQTVGWSQGGNWFHGEHNLVENKQIKMSFDQNLNEWNEP